ncbi:MAG: propanediol utilization protein [Planctomycetes bacterium]|nr:propanediol utilization protein [Planctomycetota bacterium]
MTRSDYNPEMRSEVTMGPAIGLLELGSVARGIETVDSILWEADIELLFASSVQPGKYAMLFSGSVDDLQAALRRGAELAGNDLIDRLLIPQIHPQVENGLRRRDGQIEGTLDALGVIETTSIAAAILAADAALKQSAVDLLELRIANGLGGRSYLSVTGEVSDVRSAVLSGSKSAETSGMLLRQVVISRPHPDLSRHL